MLIEKRGAKISRSFGHPKKKMSINFENFRDVGRFMIGDYKTSRKVVGTIEQVIQGGCPVRSNVKSLEGKEFGS